MSDAQHSGTTGQGYDREIKLKGVLGFSLGVIVAILLASALMWWMSVALRDELVSADPPPSVIPEAAAEYQPPGPRLQDEPEQELEALRHAEEQVLTSYQWVDQSAGVAQIPVARAIAILAAEVAAGDVGEGLAPSRGENVGEGLAPSRAEVETENVGEGLAPSRDGGEEAE